MKFKFEIKQKDIDKLSRELRALSLKKKAEVRDQINETALNIEGDAKRAVTGWGAVDTGRYRSSIRSEFTSDGLGAKTGSDVGYGPYLEFGTGRLVEVPPELQDFAAQFKGQGIREVNLPARPHLYPAFLIGSKRFMENLKKIFARK